MEDNEFFGQQLFPPEGIIYSHYATVFGIL